MIVDSLASIPVTQDPDIRIKRKSEVEDQRSIEETEKGNDLELNFNRNKSQDVESARQPDEADDSVEVKIYNAKGRISDTDNGSQGNNPDTENGLDLIV